MFKLNIYSFFPLLSFWDFGNHKLDSCALHQTIVLWWRLLFSTAFYPPVFLNWTNQGNAQWGLNWLAIALLSNKCRAAQRFPLSLAAQPLIFLPFSVFCFLVMARQTSDGAFSDGGFDNSEYSVSSCVVLHHQCNLISHMIPIIDVYQNMFWFCCELCLITAVLLSRLYLWSNQKGYCSVPGQQYRLNKCLFSAKYRYWVWMLYIYVIVWY